MKMETRKRAIDKVYKRRNRYEIPEWQRQEVWSRSKKQNLIDSILRGWKLPKFYLLRLPGDREEYEVVDGQQRLATIFEFFDNDLLLSDGTAKAFGGNCYEALPDKVKDSLDDYEIEFDVIEDAADEEVKVFFQRLQEGLPLTSSEKLNSVHSRLRDFVMRQTKNAFFQKVAASDKRYGHFDIVAKVAAIEIDGIEVGLRYDDLRAVFDSQAHFSPRSNVAKRIKDALDYADKGFSASTGSLRNRTIVQSVLTLICRLIQSGKATGKEKAIARFVENFLKELSRQVELGQRSTEPDYLVFQRTVNANIRTGARVRQEFLLRKLLAADPAFIEMFDAATVAESSLQKAIREHSGEISSLIGRINETYAADHGQDLIKATNTTAQALTRLGTPVVDFNGYKNFVDDLYFLFHESVGTRLDGKKPPESFADVNTLRTDLQHDLDHGKAKKVRAKRRKSGQVFKKYAGAPSPASVAPERFLVVQANVLGALKRDLHNLTW